ncbi:biotin carboxyl carrier domain-containing protein [Pseudomonas sp. BN417]|uniref:acetyl-CoA carboxylase n=1 Tax=Pseudomonas sp. BN417 TaxID=2567890 RepID=UPI002453EA3C|nr:acetyl-CoA carboxylase [Pseudomonas sp. BN417]MDH4556096.1 biotin carboxyl carrier domain-containing protein [Pseudomonas sp. BN417]
MAEFQVFSPLPGTFYRKPSPEADNYANEGDTVAANAVIGLVEVMKQFSELTADQGGRVLAFHVEDGDPVEPGQLLAVIETDA